MEKKLDSVYEAYMGDLNKEFTQSTRKRVHWICEQAMGKHILDIGCSQGISSLLLGREGKMVLGLDVEQDSIEFANHKLQSENPETIQNVAFEVGNFLLRPFGEERYNTIILTEVLEHIVDINPFLEKAKTLLDDSGRVIITVPFGINDFWDHKKTYYVADMYEKLEQYFDIQAVEFFTKWIGFVCEHKNSQKKSVPVDLNLLKKEETCFYAIERMLTDKCNKLKEMYEKSKEQVKACEDKYIAFKKAQEQESIVAEQKQEQERIVIEQEKECYEEKNVKNMFLLNDQKIMLAHLQKSVELKQKEKQRMEKRMHDLEEKNKNLEEKNKNLEEKNKNLEEKNKNLDKKYNDLANSKLGILTLKIWDMRRK